MILLTIFLFFVSLVFLFSGKVHTTTINRRYGYIRKEKTTVLCKNYKREGYLNELSAITCSRKGFEGLYNKTLVYRI